METIKEKLYERGPFNYFNFAFLREAGFAREYRKKGFLNYSEYQENARRRSGRGDSDSSDGTRGLQRDGRGAAGEASFFYEGTISEPREQNT
ncbi:MAG: hypothetical protein IJD10_07820, partial [Clostridia bacterium]|nr:hypothetical protein [Clostridia bacterium]